MREAAANRKERAADPEHVVQATRRGGARGRAKILYVQPYIFDGGPHRSLCALISNLDRKRAMPYLAATSADAPTQEYETWCCAVWIDRGIGLVPRSMWPWIQCRFASNLYMTALRLAKRIREERIDLVHTNSEACWVGGLAASMAGVPAVAHLHGLSILSPAWVGWVSVRVLNRFHKALIATSEAVRRAYLNAGANGGALRVVANGVDVNRFDPGRVRPALRSELNLEPCQPLIGMIANIDPRKGHHQFVDACNRVLAANPAARFVVVGTSSLPGIGSYCERLKRQIVEKNLSRVFEFLGPREDIPEVLASLDVVVQPSLTEAGPLVPLEAMSMERPLIVSDAGGNPEEVANGETGLVVPVNDSAALSEGIITLMKDKNLAARLGKAGRERVLRFFRAEFASQKVQAIYDELLNCTPRQAEE